MTEDADRALIEGQLADLTHVVEDMPEQLQRLLQEAAGQRTRRMYSRSASTLQRVN